MVCSPAFISWNEARRALREKPVIGVQAPARLWSEAGFREVCTMATSCHLESWCRQLLLDDAVMSGCRGCIGPSCVSLCSVQSELVFKGAQS